MAKRTLSLLLGLFVMRVLAAQYYTYGSDVEEWPAAVAPASSGFAILGSRPDFSGGYDLLLVLTDTSGIPLDSKLYGNVGMDYGAGICRVAAGYFLLGTTYAVNNVAYKGRGDFLLIRTDSNGNELSRTMAGGSQEDVAAGLAATSDGGCLAAGTTRSRDIAGIGYSYGSQDILILRFDSQGQVVWKRLYGGSGPDRVSSIRLTSDGGFIVVGTTSSGDGVFDSLHGPEDAFALKCNASGQVEWAHTFGGSYFDGARDVTEVPGGYVVTGYRSKLDPATQDVSRRFDRDLYVCKLDENGNTVWEKTYDKGHNDEGLSIRAMGPAGGFLVAGYAEGDTPSVQPYSAYRNAWILRLDPSGGVLWEVVPAGDGNASAISISPSGTGTRIGVIGQTDDHAGIVSQGQKDIWMTTFDNAVQALEVYLGPDVSVCAGMPVHLNPAVVNCAGCTYLWDDGSTAADRTIVPQNTQDYSVTVTSASGQSAADTITVSVWALPDVSVQISPAVNGQATGSIAVTPAGTSPFFIQWDQGQMSFALTQLAAGAYHFVLTDGHGCTVDSTVTVPMVTATGQAELSGGVHVCPNPTSGVFHLACSARDAIRSVVLCDATGRILARRRRANSFDFFETRAAGTYYLVIEFETGRRVVKRLIIY